LLKKERLLNKEKQINWIGGSKWEKEKDVVNPIEKFLILS